MEIREESTVLSGWYACKFCLMLETLRNFPIPHFKIAFCPRTTRVGRGTRITGTIMYWDRMASVATLLVFRAGASLHEDFSFVYKKF